MAILGFSPSFPVFGCRKQSNFRFHSLFVSRIRFRRSRRLKLFGTHVMVADRAAGSEDRVDEIGKVMVERVGREVGDGLAVRFGRLSGVIRKALMISVIGLGGFGGWQGTTRLGEMRTVRAAAACMGVAATMGGMRILERRGKKAVKTEIVKGLAAGELGTEGLEKVRRRFGVNKKELREVLVGIYRQWLSEIVRRKGVRYGEMSELIRLKRSLGLTGVEIGTAHYEVGREFYRENVVYLDAEDMEKERKESQEKLNKLLFLSDRLFSDREPEEAYEYESIRLREFFGLSKQEAEEKIASVALPFYKQVVSRAAVDSSIDAVDLQAAQSALGVLDRQAMTIRLDAYADRVSALVSQKGRLDAVDNEALARLRKLFSIPEERASATLKSLAEPVYREEVRKALDAIAAGEDSYARIYGKLALRQSELGMPAGAPRVATATEVSARAVDILSKASKYLRVQNLSSTVRSIDELLKLANDVVQLMKVGEEKAEDESIISAYFVNVAKDALAKTEPRQMYRIYLSHCLADRKVDDKEAVALTRLRSILNLTETDANTAFNAAAGPVYRKAVSAAVKPTTPSSMSTLDEDSKAQLVSLRNDLVLPEKAATDVHLDLYAEKLGSFVADNRVLNESEGQLLASIRGFLDLSNDDVAGVHTRLCGPVYSQSVGEAMGTTGIMLDEYREGLDRLRIRLGLSEKDAQTAFYGVAKARMRVYAEKALGELQKRSRLRPATATTPTGKERDTGEDPYIKRAGATLGIEAGGLAVELSNLVDFYTRNKIMQEEEVEVEVEEKAPTAQEASDKGAAESENAEKVVKKTRKEKRTLVRYPVTLRGDIPENVMGNLYKNYVVQCFSASARTDKQRLFGALDQLGSILGLTEKEVAGIHAEIGTVIYKNYVNQALSKGQLEQKDVEFLGNIQRMLSMSEKQCSNILKDAKESRVNSLIEQVFSKTKVETEIVRRVRQTSKSLGIDLVKDLRVGPDVREKLFGLEIDSAIESGVVSPENQALISEAQTDLQLDDTQAKAALLKCIQRRTVSHLVQASASLRLNASENAAKELQKMLTFGKLLPAKVVAPAVSEAEKQELYLLYQAYVITEEKVEDETKQELSLLKTMLGFSDAELEEFKLSSEK